MKYDKICLIVETLNDNEYLEKIENIDPANLEFVVKKTGDHLTLQEMTTKIIIFKTTDEAYADETCDNFNHDKDAGKDALINAIKTLYMKDN